PGTHAWSRGEALPLSTQRRPRSSRLLRISTASSAALPKLGDPQPDQEADHREEVGDAGQPVAGVCDRQGHVFDSDTSQIASIGKPSITPSTQYGERPPWGAR